MSQEINKLIKRLFKAFKEKIQGKPLSVRSSRWETVRKHFLLTCPSCAACGATKHLQVHHIKPFHLHPELELDVKNLIVLCEGKENLCHLNVGHLGNWHKENPDVVMDAAKILMKMKKIS